jgi:LysM repeat protein
MSTNDKNMNNESSDKTIVFNSAKNVDSDKTQVQQPSNRPGAAKNDDKTLIDAKPTSSESESNAAGEKHKPEIKKPKDSQGISPGVLAAGMAGAGVAGVAAGTVFSDEIKGTVEGIAATFSGSNDEIPEVAEVAEDISHDSASLVFSDATGVYEVTLTDSLGDGTIDSLGIDAQMVDGTSVQFSASGTVLDQLFQSEQVEVAGSNDYLANIFDIFEGFTPESLNSVDYQIQYGDTLSEIAAANNTTVAHIMDLNPHLDNPNVIMAGDHLVIPTDDFASNPYEGWNPEWSQSSEVYLAEGDSTFDTMDWASFEDQPLDDYSGFLYTEDFQDYEAIDTYFDDSNDLASLDFFA